MSNQILTHTTLLQISIWRQAGRSFLGVELSAQWPPYQWHPGEKAGKHAAVSEAAGLFVIFSKVTRDCRALTQWKTLTEIMMEKDNKVKMDNSSENP